MTHRSGLAETVPERVFLRLVAVLCIVIACVLLLAGVWADPAAIAPGGLMLGGFALAASACLISLVLNLIRRGD